MVSRQLMYRRTSNTQTRHQCPAQPINSTNSLTFESKSCLGRQKPYLVIFSGLRPSKGALHTITP